MKSFHKIEFKAEVVRETSYSVTSLGEFDNTMEIFSESGKLDDYMLIEWVVGDEVEVEHIGIWVGMKGGKPTLTDYDGVFSLPREAVKLLRKVGVRVPKEFTDI